LAIATGVGKALTTVSNIIEIVGQLPVLKKAIENDLKVFNMFGILG
jgi:hypothetical protein